MTDRCFVFEQGEHLSNAEERWRSLTTGYYRGVPVGEGVLVGVSVSVWVDVPDGVVVPLGLDFSAGVAFSVEEDVSVGVEVCVVVGVSVGVAVGVDVGVAVGVADGVGRIQLIGARAQMRVALCSARASAISPAAANLLVVGSKISASESGL